MALFNDDDGQPIEIGDEVNIQFYVVSAVKVKDDDLFPTVTLRLKHPLQGMKMKIDSGSPDKMTAPACVIAKHS